MPNEALADMRHEWSPGSGQRVLSSLGGHTLSQASTLHPNFPVRQPCGIKTAGWYIPRCNAVHFSLYVIIRIQSSHQFDASLYPFQQELLLYSGNVESQTV